MAYNALTVTNSATLIVSANTSRLSLIITNQGPGNVYFGQDASITSSNCPYLLPDGTLTEDSGGQKMYCGPIYGIAPTSSNIRYWERTR